MLSAVAIRSRRFPLARRLGIEAHTAVFRHRDGPGHVVGIEIPETPEPLIVEGE